MAHNITFSGANNHGFQLGYSSGTINVFHGEPSSKSTPNYHLGLSLGDAPQTDDDLFVGRETELVQLKEWLTPNSEKQNVVVVSGLGGMGKTQLSIHFAKHHHGSYSSVIWLNAKDPNTLTNGYISLALRIMGEENCERELKRPDVEEAVRYVRRWLSQPKNHQWLIIYDNYDDPQIPGIKSPTGYDVRQFFPERTHGSILITTRSSRLKFAKQLRLVQLEDVHQSLAILANRSGRETEGDTDAHNLAIRLDGLPLALTTAGAYISQTTDDFGDYLEMYEKSWEDLHENSDELLEYADRTLYSTWNISLKQVEVHDPEAANLLQLMAYLSNHDLWYELFQKGSEFGPPWLSTVVKSKARFNKAMAKLQEYSLVEARVGSYSLHTCVHDWTTEYLNHGFDELLCRLAIHCVSMNVRSMREPDFVLGDRRLIPHARRLGEGPFKGSIDWKNITVNDIYNIGYLNDVMGRYEVAETMYELALEENEKIRGFEDPSTLVMVNDLGVLYMEHGKMAMAQTMLLRSLEGQEKIDGVSHPTIATLNTLNNLGFLYVEQGKTIEAKAMYKRALRGYEQMNDVNETKVAMAGTLSNLGLLYMGQGKLVEAETMLKRALELEESWGVEHMEALKTLTILGNLYIQQAQMTEAEKTLERALQGCEKALGGEDIRTLDIMYKLGVLYWTQGRSVEAERMCQRALKGYEKVCGLEHESTLDVLDTLGSLYESQDRLSDAEVMWQRALEGFNNTLGPEDPRTMKKAKCLGLLNDWKKANEAMRALDGEGGRS